MEAKETRMDELRLWSILEGEKEKPKRSIILVLKQVRDEQAEISFKAGEQAQRDRQSVVETEAYFRGRSTGLEASKEERLAGIREVVEWIKEQIAIQTTDQGLFISGYIAGEKWQAKLKEWGLEM